MSVFVDTNILLRSVQPTHPMHEAAVNAIAALIQDGETLVITPQIFAEFWNAATRPVDRNGMGLSHSEAHQEIVRLERFLSMLPESIDVYAEWKRLVLAHNVAGVRAHDARIVAAMNVYGVRRILTFNVDDFRRYEGIETIQPS